MTAVNISKSAPFNRPTSGAAYDAEILRGYRAISATVSRPVPGTIPFGSGGFYYTNPIPTENAITGVADSTVGYGSIGSGTNGFYGYAKQFSGNVGDTIAFAVDGTGATNIAIHRIGHYNSLRWRLVATVANTGTNQPDSTVLPNSAGATTCAGWSTTATWSIPGSAVSGLYMAVVRDSGNVARSWIPFVVREDNRAADIVIRVSDSTWGGAYNYFGTKASPLDGKSVYGQGIGGSVFAINLRGVQMSYDRPVVTRGATSGGNFVNHWDVLESSLIDWVERNGYNVKYISCYDLDQGLGRVGPAKVLTSAGHDEYWSDGMVNNTEAFINSGGHHVVFSANTQFWRIRWADNGRTFWCYKDTMDGPTALRTGGGGTAIDPVSWTGTWRDTRWAQRRPESLLLGATFRMNGIRDETMTINAAANQTRPFWRNTTVASGTNLTVAGVIGFEADSTDFPNVGGVSLGTTTININGSYADDNGQNYSGNGNLDWGIGVFYPKPGVSGSGLNVNFQTNQWMWGLSDYHRRGSAVRNLAMRQATLNLLADLGVPAESREGDLTAATPVALSTYGATRPSVVTVAASPSSVQENGTTNIVYTFTRSLSSGSLSVNYTISGTATNGTDYATIASPVVFADGSTTAQVVVDPTADATSESGGETVILTIAAGSGYSAGSPSSATATIDEPGVPSVSVAVSPSSVAEDGGTNLVYTFTRTLTTGTLAVNYTISGTATNGTDYATIASPVNFADGSANATVVVDPTTDATSESDETVILTVAAGSGYAVGSPSSATGTILNDEAGPLNYQLTPDSTIVATAAVDPSSYEMGMRFQVSENTVATAIKFYRPVTNTNANGLIARTWRTTLWSQNQPMASGTVTTAASQTGWITATLDNPIDITTGITYAVTVLIPTTTGYGTTAAFFTSGVVPGSPNPLTAATNAGGFGANRLQALTTFNNTFYHVQPVVSGVTAAKVMWTPSAGYTDFLLHGTEGPYELGSRYTVTANQSITGVRFLYAQDDTTTTTTVRVWNSTGTLLASKAATGIIAGVYNTVLLDTAVAVTAGQTFVVSYTSGTRVSISNTVVTQNRAVPFGTYVRNALNVTAGSYPDTAAANRDYYITPLLA